MMMQFTAINAKYEQQQMHDVMGVAITKLGVSDFGGRVFH